jgi:organic radical activating enzyme
MGGHSDLCITARNGELLTRRLVAEGYSRDRLIGGFVVSWFIQNAIKIYPKAFPQARIPNEIESPAELLEISDSDVTLCRSGLYEVELFALEGFNLNIENSGSEDDYYLALPKIECDHLTILTEVWNHFQMCAAIASSMENPVVNMITTERNTLEIHGSNDHEEYRAEIFLTGGEPPSHQAIAIPVALIDEVSYWIETGLHIESHLDIWFDQDHIKIGTKTNQVSAEIEEFQHQKYNWQSESPTLIKEMWESDRQILKSLLYESSNEQLECDTPMYYAPLIEFHVTEKHLFLQMNSYQQNVQSVSIGIAELRDFVEYIDITKKELMLKIEANTEENYVMFWGDSPCGESKEIVHFSYLLLGVLANTKNNEEMLKFSGYKNNQLLSFEKTEEWIDCTRENSLTIEEINFIERFPLDFKADSNPKRNSKKWQSVSKQEPPLNNLIKLINNLKNEINDFLESYSISVTEIIEEEIGSIELLNIQTLDILEIFKSKYPSDYQNYSILIQAWYDLNHAVNQTKVKMFDPESSNTSMQTLEKVHKETQWVYFRFLNKYYWGNENPQLWQQTFNDFLTVDDLETAIAAQVNSLEESSIRNLKKLASHRKIKNYGNLRKEELILALSMVPSSVSEQIDF